MNVERHHVSSRIKRDTERFLLCMAALVTTSIMWSAADAATETSASDGSDADDGDSGSSSSASQGVGTLVKLLSEGDAVLIHHRPRFWTTPPCENKPFVLSKIGTSNKNCGALFDAFNISCTCLDGFVKRGEWKFQVTSKMASGATPKTSLNAMSSIPITKIAPFFFPKSATSVKIIATNSTSDAIEFLQDIAANGATLAPKMETRGNSQATIRSVHLENINLANVITNADFFRPSLMELTLRNCDLTDDATALFTTLVTLQSINLENNKFTKFPIQLLGLGSLKKLSLGGNGITSVTLNERQYQTVSELSEFTINTLGTSTDNCVGGSIKSAHNVQFCVMSVTGVTTEPSQKIITVTTESSSSGTNKYLLIGAIGGCVVVALLLFLVVRRRSSRHKENAFVKHTASDSMFEETTAFDNSESQQNVSSTLLNDPIIITHRLPYNDIKVATCISRGGFGLVYSGTFNRRRVAIKKIRPELNGDIKHIESFLKEICLMASLNHPRIVDFIGVSWDSLRNLSAVTEFMDRGDLRDVLRSAKERNVRLSWESHKTRIAMHVAEALTYLHSLSPKVIHRDLKSKNILLDNEMTAKLSDFGVSRERRMEETHMTAGIGTAFWIAPEVLLGMDYDERADIFSFGVVLSEIDTNDYPYWNEKNPTSGGKHEENAILRMVATGALRPEFTESCPDHILMLADACLEVDPELRPTAAQIVYTLQKSLRASPLTPQSAITPQ